MERFPLVADYRGRQTLRLSETVRLIGYMLGGEPGSRLADRLGMEVSADTVLRRVKQGPVLLPSRASVVGVDDWAWRKGQNYGTILVDLGKHRPLDLLPDRSATSLADWLQQHPEVRIISRDRAGVYAEGATEGAPQAVQVADRWHLLCNLTAAVERVLEQRRSELRRAVPPSPAAVPEPAAAEPAPRRETQAQRAKQARRQRRLERYDEALELYRQGLSQAEIGRRLHLERKTIRRYLRAGAFPERATPKRSPGAVSRFQDYLQRRWNEGCRNASQLWREIRAQGYAGGRGMVARLVMKLRTPGTKYFREHAARAPSPPVVSPRQFAILLTRKPEKLQKEQQELIAKLSQSCPEIGTVHRLAQDFAALVRAKGADSLSQWIDGATASGLSPMRRFCEGLHRDRAAVTAALSTPWSNGQVEGQVHRLKLIKRQMYGRAGFALLKCRVLPYSQRPDPSIGDRGP